MQWWSGKKAAELSLRTLLSFVTDLSKNLFLNFFWVFNNFLFFLFFKIIIIYKYVY